MIILTSVLVPLIENNNKIEELNNVNHILDNIKKHLKKRDNFLFVANNLLDVNSNNEYAKKIFDTFEITLPFKNYYILDTRTLNQIDKLIKKADFIFLCGGHLPTQNEFFNKINLKEKIRNTNALIVGESAGSMNCANIVYIAPEIEGESIDENFKRYNKGLGLTDINILPHYQYYKNILLDGKRFLEDILIPDSYNHEIIGLPDGSYFLIDEDGNEELYGEAYSINKGKIKTIKK